MQQRAKANFSHFLCVPCRQCCLSVQVLQAVSCLVLDWLQHTAEWDEYDDPNTVITNMLVVLKKIGVEVTGVPGKLKQGYGESVCILLHRILKEVLRQNFEWQTPAFPDEGYAEEADVDSDAEIHSVDEDDMLDDGEEDELMYQEQPLEKPDEDSDDEHQVLEGSIDPKEWLLEVERVAPKLKIQIPNDSKEWRSHLEQTTGFKLAIDKQFPSAKNQLEKLSKELNAELETIRSKENFINSQFDHRALDYRHQAEELAQVQTQYTELNEVVMNLQNELKTLSEELEDVKSSTEEHSSTVTDTTPIVKMKDAFKRLRVDTRQLEVRIGVVSHTLMQAKLRQKPQDAVKRGLYGGVPGANNQDYDDDNSP